MKPKISIVVPVFNVEGFLNRCVDSLLNQSHKNLEIILVNDASTDSSGDICNNYKNENDKIVVIHRKLSSGSASLPRNTGLKLASGKYISFVDSDDWIHPEMIASLLDALVQNDVKVAECELIETDNYFIKPITNNLKSHFRVETRLDAFKRVIQNQRFSVCVRLYELEFIQDFSFPENVISEDVFFTLEVLKKIDKLVRTDEPFYYYYITPNSITRKSYSLKYFDSLNSGLHLQKYIHENEKDSELLEITQRHILKKLLYHYKMLNYNPNVDPNYTNRKWLKNLININYFKNKNLDSYLKLAYYLPIKPFEILINFNKMRHRIFKTNEFL